MRRRILRSSSSAGGGRPGLAPAIRLMGCALTPSRLLAAGLLVAALAWPPAIWASAAWAATDAGDDLAQTDAVERSQVLHGAGDSGSDSTGLDEDGRMEPLPDELEGIGITEHLDEMLPLDLEFTDEQGRTVRLGDYFGQDRPVLVNLVYYTCPMLCTLVLNGVVEGIRDMSLELGEDFTAVTVSIDPSETPALARAKKDGYISEYGRPGGAAGWHFLTGEQDEITALAEALGFGYRYDPKSGEYIHTAATFACTPEGRISRYLYGIEYEAQTFKLALLEAGEGKIGSSLDRLILFCFHYDSASGRYAPYARNIMRAGGALTALVLGIVLAGFWARESKRRKKTTGEQG